MTERGEGVRGHSYDHDPLLTADGSIVAAEMMGLLYRAVLVGNPAPVVQRMLERMNDPRPGGPVVVYDAIHRGDEDTKHKGVGYLVARRAELVTDDAEWDSVEHAWYVQYGPNPEDVCRWTNCTVLSIPRDA